MYVVDAILIFAHDSIAPFRKFWKRNLLSLIMLSIATAPEKTTRTRTRKILSLIAKMIKRLLRRLIRDSSQSLLLMSTGPPPTQTRSSCSGRNDLVPAVDASPVRCQLRLRTLRNSVSTIKYYPSPVTYRSLAILSCEKALI